MPTGKSSRHISLQKVNMSLIEYVEAYFLMLCFLKVFTTVLIDKALRRACL